MPHIDGDRMQMFEAPPKSDEEVLKQQLAIVKYNNERLKEALLNFRNALTDHITKAPYGDTIPWRDWHFANLNIRHNGEFCEFEADWLKDVFYADAKAVALLDALKD